MHRHILRGLMIGAVALVAGCGGSSEEKTGSVSLASNVHLKGGPRTEPVFVDNGLTLSTNSALSGLGNGDIQVELSATGQPTGVCQNPSGTGQEPPGQNPAPVTLTGVQTIPESEIKNGTVKFNVATGAPRSPVPGAPDCPNPQWTEIITDVAFTSATITVQQPVGTTVLTLYCTFSPSTSNGAVSGSSVTCQEI